MRSAGSPGLISKFSKRKKSKRILDPIKSTIIGCTGSMGLFKYDVNQEVPPTGLGKCDSVMMPVLRQGWVVKQNMM